MYPLNNDYIFIVTIDINADAWHVRSLGQRTLAAASAVGVKESIAFESVARASRCGSRPSTTRCVAFGSNG